jgi:hypothetical protein
VYYGLHGSTTISVNAFFLEPNLFGIFSLSIVSLITPIFLFSENRAVKIPKIAIPVGLIGIALSYTRSTWLGLILVTVCLWIAIQIKGNKKTKHLLNNYFLLLCVLGIMIITSALVYTLLGGQSNFIDRMTFFTSPTDPRHDSGSVRLMTWKYAFMNWQNNIWFGTGPLSSIAYGSTTGGWLYSSLVQTLHDSGLVGLLFMLWFCIGCMVYVLYAYFRSNNNTDSGILLGYFLAQVSLFFTSQFSSFFWGGFTWVLLGLSVGHSWIVVNNQVRKLTVYSHEGR